MTLMIVGIDDLPVDWWIRNDLSMGMLFLTASTLPLNKALRDRHGYGRLVNSARTGQVLSECGS